MKTTFNIKNFRIFDSEGHTFEINPITILTGCNSSGKSSFTKACELFADWLKAINADFRRGSLDVLFTTPLRLTLEHLKLGRLDSVINNDKYGDHCIIFQHTLNNLAIEDVHVTYTFASKKNDIANNAWLSTLRIVDDNDNVLFYADRTKESFIMNLYPLKKWAGDIRLYYDYINDQRLGGPTSSYEYNTEYGIKLANSTKTKKEYKDLFSIFLKENFGEVDEFQNRLLSKGDCEFIAIDDITKPLIYDEKLEELDGIQKDELQDYIITKINKGDYFPHFPNDEYYHKEDYDRLLYTLENMISQFKKTKYNTLSDFLGALENQYGLAFEAIEVLDAEGVMYEIHPRHYKHDDINIISDKEAYKRYIHFLSELFFGKYSFNEIFSCGYINEFINKTCIPFFYEAIAPEEFLSFKYIGTTQLELNRVFPLNGGRFSSLLKDYISSISTYGSLSKKIKRGVFINKWIKKLNIGSKVDFKLTEEGSGVVISIKDLNSTHSTNICDMGHGTIQLLSILLAIETAIYNSSGCWGEIITISIEEPESHLHPKYQSLLASLFADAFLNHNIHFIIETHSEYLIRALQKCIAYGPGYYEYGLKNTDVSIFYFNEPRKGLRLSNEPQVRKIEIAEDGCLINPFGPGFFDEALNLSTDLLRIKLERNAKK